MAVILDGRLGGGVGRITHSLESGQTKDNFSSSFCDFFLSRYA